MTAATDISFTNGIVLYIRIFTFTGVLMNLALVDDLQSDLEYLQKLLSEYCSFVHEKSRFSLYYSGEEFLSVFCPEKFDAVFLDNLMDGINGMETARRLRAIDPSIPIIFITAEESFALEGYTVQAMDYILKPVSKNRLASVMNRLLNQKNSRHTIEIKENRMTRYLNLDDVLYVRSVGHFLEIQTTTDVLKPYMTLEYFLSLLQQLGEYGESSLGLRFQNCCRGYVVCFDYVSAFTSLNFVMSDGSKDRKSVV